MKAFRRWAWVMVGLVGVACGDSEGAESTGSTTAGSTATGEGTAGSTTTTSDGGSTSSDAASASTSGTTTTSSTSSTGSTGGGTTGDATDGGTMGAGVCMPTPDDGECFTCVKSNCCVAWSLCEDEEQCSCILECHVVDGNSLGNCRSQCGDSELYNGVYFCGQMYCLGLCDWQSP